jgi:hypothetical protein
VKKRYNKDYIERREFFCPNPSTRQIKKGSAWSPKAGWME